MRLNIIVPSYSLLCTQHSGHGDAPLNIVEAEGWVTLEKQPEATKLGNGLHILGSNGGNVGWKPVINVCNI